MADLRLIETNDGGDLVVLGSDLEVINGFENMIYLGLFGGNIEESTRKYNPTEQRFDYWANDLFAQNDSSIQFNSNTERLLNNISISSSSRLLIESTVKDDLAFMTDFGTLIVNVSLTSINRIEISISFQELNSVSSNDFTYIWDSTKNELIV